MLLSYVILALSASFAPLAFARPMQLLDLAKATPLGGADPGSLLGRHYSVQDRRQLPSSFMPDAIPADHNASNAPRRLVPYAKYLADRSDDSWLRVRERRAGGNVDYLSNVSTYSAPKPFTPPTPPPPPAIPQPPPAPVRPSPTVTPPNVTVPVGPTDDPAKAKASKDAQKKHTSKAKATKEKHRKDGEETRAVQA
ncbi:hypothetical protein BC628DRAFT_484411 [Trametes gibbosa]|nr:hypothetical protein BC628DRAFT_484411 [Trametes gibbosa]